MYKKIVKTLLDNVGAGFCLAKWTTSTMHLSTGKNHSCHHPSPHVIPLDEIKKNSAALHNSNFKQEQRKTMLNGGRPEECKYCWNIEDHGNKFSDRIITSSKINFIKDYHKIKNSNYDDPATLRMLEVSFSNVCNLSCAYCGPDFSSKWFLEIASQGSYKNSENYNAIVGQKYLTKEENPYIDAFWEYLPTVYADLKILRITGGEPLLSKHTEKLFDFILTNPNPTLQLIINTNLSVDKKILDKFLDRLKKIKPNVKKINIATSGESIGEQANYTRDGIDYYQWLKNCHYVLETKLVTLQLMCSYNLLSITTFSKFITDIAQLKKNYKTTTLSISYVQHPSFLSAHMAPKEYKPYLEESLALISKYFPGEAENRFKHVMTLFSNNNPTEQELNSLRYFIQEYDYRRHKNFQKTFPEYDFINYLPTKNEF